MEYLIGCKVVIPSTRKVSSLLTDQWGRVIREAVWEDYMQRGIVIRVQEIEGVWVALVENHDLGKRCEYRAEYLQVVEEDYERTKGIQVQGF